MKLQELRDIIDQIDAAIVKLIAERLDVSVLTKNCKDSIEDADREQELQKLWADYADHCGLSEQCAQEILGTIIAESKRLQSSS